jgi:hypothetical protein
MENARFSLQISRREAYLGSAMVISNDPIKGFRWAYILKVMRLDHIPDCMPFVEEFGVVSSSNHARMPHHLPHVYERGEVD